VFGVIAGAGLLVTVVVSALANTKALYRLEAR
jgi:hypothetical protein